MQRRTRQQQLETAAEEWKRSYQYDEPPGVYDKLVALGPHPTVAQVAEIVGASHWIMTYWIANTCTVCGQDVPVTVEIAEDCDECGPSRLCPACLQKAVALCQD